MILKKICDASLLVDMDSCLSSLDFNLKAETLHPWSFAGVNRVQPPPRSCKPFGSTKPNPQRTLSRLL